VDLVEEGFDVAFRVGSQKDSSLVQTKLGPASVFYCASPAYVAARGTPSSVEDLDEHECVALAPEGTPARWLFVIDAEPRWRPVSGRLRLNHLPTAKRIALAGGGIVNLPAFACAAELEGGTLVSLLADHVVPFGNVSLVYAERQLLAPRVRRFVDLTVERFREGRLLEAHRAAPGGPPPRAGSRRRRRAGRRGSPPS